MENFLRRLPIPRPGQVLGLVGTNGIGKSTALKVLAGKLKPNLGRFDVRLPVILILHHCCQQWSSLLILNCLETQLLIHEVAVTRCTYSLTPKAKSEARLYPLQKEETWNVEYGHCSCWATFIHHFLIPGLIPQQQRPHSIALKDSLYVGCARLARNPDLLERQRAAELLHSHPRGWPAGHHQASVCRQHPKSCQVWASPLSIWGDLLRLLPVYFFFIIWLQ